MRTPEQDREWLLRMAAAEDEALAGCDGVLACSPEIYALMNECTEEMFVTVSVPTDVVDQIKKER